MSRIAYYLRFFDSDLGDHGGAFRDAGAEIDGIWLSKANAQAEADRRNRYLVGSRDHWSISDLDVND